MTEKESSNTKNSREIFCVNFKMIIDKWGMSIADYSVFINHSPGAVGKWSRGESWPKIPEMTQLVIQSNVALPDLVGRHLNYNEIPAKPLLSYAPSTTELEVADNDYFDIRVLARDMPVVIQKLNRMEELVGKLTGMMMDELEEE